MPELAEVEFYRRRWAVAHRQTIRLVQIRPDARVFREGDATALALALTGRTLVSSAAAAKQMLFRFSGDAYVGIHLGMAGELLVTEPNAGRDKHAHLILETADHALVFRDYRMFGRVLWYEGSREPAWWRAIPPAITSEAFTPELVAAFCQRRAKAPLKAVLLMQEAFPGIGNWMADEILWRGRFNPSARASSLDEGDYRALHAKVVEVTRDALREIAGVGARHGPRELNERVPEHWLFNHRWKDGGTCPATGEPLRREPIGGRTTCWSPAWQTRP